MKEKYSNYSTKYNSPFACYLEELAMQGMYEDEEGNYGDIVFYFGKNKQHALMCDDLGFVTHVRAYAWK